MAVCLEDEATLDKAAVCDKSVSLPIAAASSATADAAMRVIVHMLLPSLLT